MGVWATGPRDQVRHRRGEPSSVTVPPLEPGEAAQVRILAGGLAGADPLAERLSRPETAS